MESKYQKEKFENDFNRGRDLLNEAKNKEALKKTPPSESYEDEEIAHWAKVRENKEKEPGKGLITIVKHTQIMFEAGNRLQKVLREHPADRNSLHEAWGLIREEFLELEDELRKKNPRYRDIADEAYDVMITCARLIAFCNDRLPQEFMPDLKNKDGKYPGHEDHF